MSRTTTKKAKIERASRPLPQRRIKPRVFQVRMSEDTLIRLAEVAEWKGLSPSTLARMWLLECLAQEREAHPGRSKYGDWVTFEVELEDEPKQAVS